MENKIINLLKLCIEKDLNFSYSETKLVCVSKQSKTNNGLSFYETAPFYDFLDEDRKNKYINNLIEKVKNYKK